MNMKKNYVYAGITVFMWGTTTSVAKAILSNMSNFQTLAIGSVLAFLFLLVMNCVTGNIRRMKEYTGKDYLTMAGLGFLGLFVYSSLYYYGISVLTAQAACILNYLWPIMIVVFSCIILKEKLTVQKVIAMGMSFLGIVVISAGGEVTSGTAAMLGVASCVIAAMCYGLFSVLNKKKAYNQNIAMMIIWLVTAVCSCVACTFTNGWSAVAPTQWIGLLWLGIVVNAVAYLLWALALAGSKETAKIANLAYLTPCISVVVATAVFGEPLDIRAVIALVLIIGGILIQNIKRS